MHCSDRPHYGVATGRSVGRSVWWPGYGLNNLGFKACQGQEIFLFNKTSRSILGHPSVNGAVCKWHKRSSSTTVYDQWSYRRIHRERKALSDDGHLGANLLSDVKKCINNIKWLYHINAMLHCYHSRNHLKAHRCYLVSYFSTGPSILATLMQPGRQRINTFPYAVNRKRGIWTYVHMYIEFICRLSSCSCLLSTPHRHGTE